VQPISDAGRSPMDPPNTRRLVGPDRGGPDDPIPMDAPGERYDYLVAIEMTIARRGGK